jgi:PhnB protein
MQVVPYIYLNGNAEEAIAFYQKALKTEVPQIMRYKEQPSPDMPAEYANLIMHAELITEGCTFYLSDAVGENSVKVGDNLQINLNCDSDEQIRWIFDHLTEGGQVRMKLEDTFWGALFGSLTDQFGITWSLNFQKTPMPKYEG